VKESTSPLPHSLPGGCAGQPDEVRGALSRPGIARKSRSTTSPTSPNSLAVQIGSATAPDAGFVLVAAVVLLVSGIGISCTSCCHGKFPHSRMLESVGPIGRQHREIRLSVSFRGHADFPGRGHIASVIGLRDPILHTGSLLTFSRFPISGWSADCSPFLFRRSSESFSGQFRQPPRGSNSTQWKAAL